MREDIKEILTAFFEQSKTNNIKSNHYPQNYSGLKLRVGFGRGKVAKISWVAFLGNGQTVLDGIFPVYYFFKEHHKLVLAYGISETNPPKLKWNVVPNTVTVEEYFRNLRVTPHKYHKSYVYEVYDTDAELDWNKIESDLDNLIEKYKKVLPR